MHDFYKERNISTLQTRLFRKEYLPPYAMSPIKAEGEYIRGHGELIDLTEAEGRIALEGALPYPPGILCVHPGEAGQKLRSTTSAPLSKASTSSPASPQSFKASTSRMGKTIRSTPMAMY